MAKEEEKPKATQDKGKGKAEDPKQANGTNGAKPDGKDSKKDGDLDLPPEELNEEDQKLKDELDMLVERLTESDKSLYKSSLEHIQTSIKTATSSMTAVPKPLKFLRPHYEKLTEAYEKWPQGRDKDLLADTLSVLGMTYSDDEDRRETLKYRLLAPGTDIGSWGHEYMRHLALEIGQEFSKRLDDEQDTDDITQLALSLVPFFLSHNAEADAVDVLSELEMIEQIKDYLDENTYPRVCLYMVSMVPLLTYPDNDRFLRTAHDIYLHYKQLTQAISLAIRLNDMELIKSDFNAASDKAVKRQLALILGRQRICLDLEGDDADDTELQECLNNTKLPEYFKSLAKELNVLEPKSVEDIYKSHLESSRTAGLTNTDSARHNLASAFVNAFVNAGYGDDKMMLVEGGVKQSWIWKVKEDGMVSTAASAGMLMLWDVEMGLDKIDAYTYVPEDQIKAGAALAMGIMNSGVRLDSDPTMALLGDFEGKSVNEKIARIMGLGLAYAGSNKEDLLDILLPIVSDSGLEMQLSAIAALSLGMIFVGTANSDVSEAIIQTLMDDDRQKQLKDKWTRFMTLGLGMLFFGQQEEVDVVLETLKAIDHPMSKPASVLAEICAWAGTGAVLKLQQLLHVCNEHIEEKDDKDDEDKDKKEDEPTKDIAGEQLVQAYAVLGLSLVAMGEDVGQEMVLRQFGHLMHYGEANIRKAVPLAMGLISPSNPQMKIYDTLSRYSHDNDIDVAVNAIFAMGMVGAGTNNARIAQLLRQLASYYHRDPNALFMVRIAQGLLHMGKGTMSINPFHTDRSVLSRVAAAGLLTVATALIDDPKAFILKDNHYLLYYLVTAMHPRFLITLDEDLKPLQVNVRVGQAVDVVGQAGRPKTITGWQTQNTPVLLGHGERAELEDEEWISMANVMEGVCILKKNPDWEAP
ncbi:26S proteasome regulatory subunit rpn-1 [Fulvia fulva]|uniref:26S proteasome regulatory subunit RPN1 n=1 Tax=Passalora fulva TaxID=5499 RepID=A0A9Q8PF95_PASFU|nr:26S proteasome regulatory subunit rpn-1 [Fulvia fulva]KAK4617824.1 26S proteasome regulatory subunit rpn-1 [Fulvia fulva]KAK4618713.1 26S proteasome regulatory subunit rpn-1 [Fulvia fulva]UJO21403.1 26S proteasome regulatory subunit rpn-1 [Fulvia fulva]WPV18173.1 26S proteasome regulatory subunit rpn-1 [Fulvia fulva]WPV33642.1 26S proteasome regulatory subunit rpn-1 [Fulvia fulva]